MGVVASKQKNKITRDRVLNIMHNNISETT